MAGDVHHLIHRPDPFQDHAGKADTAEQGQNPGIRRDRRQPVRYDQLRRFRPDKNGREEVTESDTHPFGLIPVSISRLLERFAYYGVRAVLVLYMTHVLSIPKEFAFSF